MFQVKRFVAPLKLEITFSMFQVKRFVLLELQLLNLLEAKFELHIQTCGNKPAKLVFPIVQLEPCWYLNFVEHIYVSIFNY